MPLVGEAARIHDELVRAYEGDCWHGPPLREILKEVKASQAVRRPPQLAHSIWGLVRHLTVWVEVAVLRINENRAIESPVAGDFPAVTEAGETAWTAALAELDRQHKLLLKLIANMAPATLDQIVPGKNYPVAVMLHGTSQHYAYHAGQIALLKKLVDAA